MAIKLLKCKLCNRTISEPAVIVGEPLAARQEKTLAALLNHLNKAAGEEMQNQLMQNKPHAHAMAILVTNARGINNYLMAANFELTEDLQELRELGRHSIHEATRQMRMTDEDLRQAVQQTLGVECQHPNAVFRLLQDLRDRYEGLGKYAPKQPEPAAPAKP